MSPFSLVLPATAPAWLTHGVRVFSVLFSLHARGQSDLSDHEYSRHLFPLKNIMCSLYLTLEQELPHFVDLTPAGFVAHSCELVAARSVSASLAE